MKKIMLVGTVGCGKTTLCQRINGLERSYKKTQAIEVINRTIDTPGEYFEHRSFLRSLMVTSVDVDLVLFLIDPKQNRYMYSPGQAAAFPVPVAGVITKADLATETERKEARELLEIAGAAPVFCVSAVNDEGIEELVAFLE